MVSSISNNYENEVSRYVAVTMLDWDIIESKFELQS